MIQGVKIKPLKVFRDERGQVMHMMRCDDGFFTQFGEVYFSVVNPGIVKGWKKHLKMTQHFAVPRGDIKLVIYDDRTGSATHGEIQEIGIGENNYQLVCIPPQVWYGFRAESKQPAMITNCSDIPHDPKEVELRPIGDPGIPYAWV
jgi:dTDP-4-dehydrorhamnose 3,5-epimerase